MPIKIVPRKNYYIYISETQGKENYFLQIV